MSLRIEPDLIWHSKFNKQSVSIVRTDTCPVAQYDRSAGQWVQSSDITIDQYKFEAGGVAKLKSFCILPVITSLEAGF